MVAMTSFYVEMCCHLVSEHEASAARLCMQQYAIPGLQYAYIRTS